MVDSSLAGATLTIDLDALASNYRRLATELDPASCAAVIKANGYGLGADRVAPALWRAGARVFFVAHVAEGVRLRGILPPSAEIHILNGLLPGSEWAFDYHGLTPVIGSLPELKAWRRLCAETGKAPPCDLHVDTGMARLGFDERELARLADDPSLTQDLDVRFVMSHLASADSADNEQNAEQLAKFKAARRILPMGAASLANSSGIFLGPDYHFDFGRPGVALFGVNPTPGRPNPMAQVITLKAKILQVREIDAGAPVGYGASHRVDRKSRIATLPVGYADGYMRALSGHASVYIGSTRVPVVGRVSMDLITIDVTGLDEASTAPGSWVEIFGPHYATDEAARDAQTIDYEILTSLGQRYHRAYVGGPAASRPPPESALS